MPLPYRNDYGAALERIEALERKRDDLNVTLEQERRYLQTDPDLLSDFPGTTPMELILHLLDGTDHKVWHWVKNVDTENGTFPGVVLHKTSAGNICLSLCFGRVFIGKYQTRASDLGAGMPYGAFYWRVRWLVSKCKERQHTNALLERST